MWSPLQILYVIGNFLIKSSTDLADVSLHSLHLYFNLLSLSPINSHSDLIFFLYMHFLQSLLLISNNLSTRSDNVLWTNLEVSINFILYVIILPNSSFSFLIGTEKVINFSVFSHYELLLGFLVVLYILNYKCYEQVI